jgi:RNA polymerase sigma factor (sigma-70 family)
VHVQFYDELLKYFMRAVKDVHEAEDLVQETFGRVLSMAALGRPVDDLRALLYEVARNLLIDRHRMGQVRQHVSDDLLLQELPGPASDNPEALVAGRQRVLHLLHTIEALPPRCRQAFVLHKIDGLAQAEIAQLMGVSLNMVERHIMLAVATCRKALGHERVHRKKKAPPAEASAAMAPMPTAPQAGE